MKLLLLALLLLSPLPTHANSDAINMRNDFESALDRYRTNMPANKCGAFRNARTDAQMLMNYHKDASLAIRWNKLLPTTRCKQARLVIDPNAIKTTKSPKLNEGEDYVAVNESLDGGGCLPITEIMALEWKRSIKASCSGGVYISITAH